VPSILGALPTLEVARREGLLGLCFVDPFRMDLDFSVIRALSEYWMDFLVMLPLGFDLRRNLRRYLDQERDDQVGAMINDRNWRQEWTNRHEESRYFIRFFVGKFDAAMERLGFRRRPIEDTVSVKVTGMGVYLYSLALYTRHELGEQFWKTTLKETDPQISLVF
jgi:three-Cys-motif partner protein